MKKRACLFGLLIFFLFLWGVFILNRNRMVQFRINGNHISILLKIDDRTEEIFPWYDETKQLYYFFLPSCVQDRKLYFDEVEDSELKVDGFTMHKGSCLLWEQEENYMIESEGIVFWIAFMKSENIPALFLKTDSGSMDYIHMDKENEEKGGLTVVDVDGHIEYYGGLEKISGRGNSTWVQIKKPYTVTLAAEVPLCGMSAGKKWNLLALYFEHDKLHSKIVYDMARVTGLTDTPQCTWIDLYCGGAYKGLYLLTESVERRIEKDEGYLVEKTIPEQSKEDESAFSTSVMGYLFKFREPRYPSKEQTDDMADFMQSIEDMIIAGNPQYLEKIDIDSIAKQFLIDKIVLEKDAMTMSTYFYRKKNGNVLYAGPMWDYDRAMGEILWDYEQPVEDEPNGMNGWYMAFYENEEFYQAVVSAYRELMPFFEQLLNEEIDVYAEKISASVAMDRILMTYDAAPNETSSYTEYESYVKYLKYFLVHRLNYLSTIWGGKYFECPASSGIYHKVIFAAEDGSAIETRFVLDGKCIENIPELDSDRYYGWSFSNRSGTPDKLYYDKIPVYEDMVLYAKKIKVEAGDK